MPPIQGIVNPFDLPGDFPQDVSLFTKMYFVNRTPLVTRLPRIATGSPSFVTQRRRRRKRLYSLGAGIADGVATTVTMAAGDEASLMVGDVLEVRGTGERVEVTADPNTTAHTLAVVRAVGTVAGAAQATAGGDELLLIGNSRTGGEVDQNGFFVTDDSVEQFIQHFEFPVQMAGALLDFTDLRVPEGDGNIMNSEQRRKLGELYEDMETSIYLGQGVSMADSSTGRPKMHGIKYLIPAANRVTAPDNAGAYKATDFMRDVLSGGGDIDLILVSDEFRTGFAIWGYPLQRIEAGATRLGTRINVFDSPYTNGAAVLHCPMLPAYTAVGLQEDQLRLRVARNESWSWRGNRGDAVEGDWIARLAVDLGDVEKHKWVEGVTDFAA